MIKGDKITRSQLTTHYEFEPNEFIQSKNGNFCGVILDKQMIVKTTCYIIALEKSLKFNSPILNKHDKEFIDKHVIIPELGKVYPVGCIILEVPLVKAWYLTKADKENSKRMLNKVINK